MKKRTKGILLLLEGTIGDTLMMLPLIFCIHKSYPEVPLHVLHYSDSGSSIARNILMPTGIIDSWRELEKHGRISRIYYNWKMRRELERIIDTVLWTFQFFTWEPNGAKKWISKYLRFLPRKGVQHFGFPKLGTDGLSALSEQKNVMQRIYIALVSDGFALQKPSSVLLEMLNFSEEERLPVVDELRKISMKKRIPILCSCGGKSLCNHWPKENWIEFFATLKQKGLDVFPIFVGGGTEREISQEIIDSYGVGVFFEKFTIRQTILLASMCKAYVGHDTGSVHIAAVAGIPGVGIYSAHDPLGIWYPNNECCIVLRARIECEGCFKHVCPKGNPSICIKKITPDAVCDALCSVLNS